MNKAAAVRASVERGDPLAVFQVRTSPDGRIYSVADYLSSPPAGTHSPETDPPQPVTADPETLDPEPDRNYPDGVTHRVKSDGRLAAGDAASCASQHSAAPPPFDRAAWLARVQRIDPRERKP